MNVQKWLFPAVLVLALLAAGCQPIRPDAGGATVPAEQETEMATLNGTVAIWRALRCRRGPKSRCSFRTRREPMRGPRCWPSRSS